MKLSVLTPCDTERAALLDLLRMVSAGPVKNLAMILVDDASADGTREVRKIPGCTIDEVGISYCGRTYQDGKKISWRDGFRALYDTFKYNLFR